MFSGIVESSVSVQQAQALNDTVRIVLERPENFTDVQLGDSIAVNGVCLTLEEKTEDQLYFTLGRETLKVTHWNVQSLANQKMNVERSLRIGDRVHGHMVSGHVDTMAKVSAIERGESWIVTLTIDKLDRRYVWAKGSITLNGVSLTVNQLTPKSLSVCLIPETLLRTNLQDLDVGDMVTIEYDTWAKAFVNYQEQKGPEQKGLTP